jgi:hypothetical protein
MLSRIKSHATSILKTFPPAKRYLKKRSMENRFKIEKALLNGTHANPNEHPSIIHFSLNKAATQYVKSILTRFATASNMVPVSIHDYAFQTDLPFLDHLSAEEMKQYRHIFKKKGYLYSVFGGMIEGIPQLDQYKVVLVARDPRDILVSEYYSVAYSHTVPLGEKRDAFMAGREKAQQTTLDDYVMSECDTLYSVYKRYQTLLLDQYPHVYLTTYEKMVDQFDRWLGGLIDYCEFSVSRELVQSVLDKNERIRPTSENIHKHMRKGQPGNYKEKLNAETIDFLNHKFAAILARYEFIAHP